MVSRELLEFAKFIRERVGSSDSNEVRLHGMLDGYGLTGPEKDIMIKELHHIGAVKTVNTSIDTRILLDKLPDSP